MHKRTRMIVLTKGKILTFLSLFALITLCILALLLLSRPKTTQVFSGYENILNRQILTTEKKQIKSTGKKLLEHIFGYKIVPTPLPIPYASPAPTSEPKELIVLLLKTFQDLVETMQKLEIILKFSSQCLT